MAFNEERLAKLRDLKVKYELTGKKWHNEDREEDSDNEDLIPAKVAGKPATAAQSAPPAKCQKLLAPLKLPDPNQQSAFPRPPPPALQRFIGLLLVILKGYFAPPVPKVASPSKIAGSKPAVGLPLSVATSSSRNSFSAGYSASAAGRFPFQERSSKKRKALKWVGKVIEFNSYGNEVLEFSSDDGGFIDCRQDFIHLAQRRLSALFAQVSLARSSKQC
ncbi:hypothetical protein C8J56DRAFT_900167 [Mycena floridula]|nr:hypothetical protein C8J56DRAFT_900167 [Mycena floridula]